MLGDHEVAYFVTARLCSDIKIQHEEIPLDPLRWTPFLQSQEIYFVRCIIYIWIVFCKSKCFFSGSKETILLSNIFSLAMVCAVVGNIFLINAN